VLSSLMILVYIVLDQSDARSWPTMGISHQWRPKHNFCDTGQVALGTKTDCPCKSFVHYSILELYMVKELQHDVCVKIDAAMPTKTHLFDSILPWCNVTCLP
jgi:hypothetical protein